jgi:AcrR family transcriptional regulator
MTARDRWLDEGMVVLAEQGARGVRVDRIAARLGLTKGSFHHHFDGIADYHRSLLERFETDSMEGIRTAVEAVSGLSPERALMELPSHVAFRPRIEAAIRGWAFDSEEASAVVTRVDTARLDALVALWERVLPGTARARTAALVPYLMMIGASVALPRPTATEMQDAFSLLATLVPAVS